MDRLKDKVAIVTGSTSGIGTGIAKMFGAEGARVVVCGRNEERGAAVVDAIAEVGGTAWFHKLDITRPETVDALFADTKEKWGSIDVLVNNAAGMALKDGRVDEISLEDWDAVFASDVRSTFYCTKTVLPFMQEQGAGSIINIGSIYGMVSPVQDIYAYKEERTGIPFIKPVAYSAAKSGIYNLTRYCATYWGKKGIRVNTLTPAGVWRDAQDETFIQNFTARMPMGRMSREDEYNGAVIFLASKASSFMTGANLVIDGGWAAW